MIHEIVLLFVAFIFLVLWLTINQSKLIYPGTTFKETSLGEPFVKIDDSFYKKGTSGTLWVILGGNSTSPSHFRELENIPKEKSDDSILLVVYPGFNGTDKIMDKENSYKCIRRCLKKIDKHEHTNFLCYSIGCAIGLYYLSTSGMKVDKCILLAPFWSLCEVVSELYGLPIFIVRIFIDHNWENFKYIEGVHKDVDISIVHGKNDRLIKYNHTAKLSKLRKCEVTFTDDDHYTVTDYIYKYVSY